MATLQFLGATGTVTGSKHLVEVAGERVLVDCGLYQGPTALRLRNWERLPVEPASVDWVVLSHGHIDHTGYLPRLIKDGFRGPISATAATADLAKILLPDSRHLQEEEAAYHNRRGTSTHAPALPLYTAEQGLAAAERVEGVPYQYRDRSDPDHLCQRHGDRWPGPAPPQAAPARFAHVGVAGRISGDSNSRPSASGWRDIAQDLWRGDSSASARGDDPRSLRPCRCRRHHALASNREPAPEGCVRRARRPRARTSPREENRERVGVDGRDSPLSRPGGDRVSTTRDHR